MLNGVTELFMMKADILSGFDTINVCSNYLIVELFIYVIVYLVMSLFVHSFNMPLIYYACKNKNN